MSSPSSFAELGLSQTMLQSIAERGDVTPTPVQAESIPHILAGRDVVVQSRTGTGKTAAFGIPILERLDLERVVPQALVLCPTRELAQQVAEEIASLGKGKGARVHPIYGGANMRRQIDELAQGLHVVVGTPGRVLDHLRAGRLNLRAIRFLVLDEADEMLSMGFFEEVSAILARVPKERETMLFSATSPASVEGLIYRHQKEPARISLSSDSVLVAEVNHAFYVTPTMEKAKNLGRVLLHEEPRSAIIFCNTRDEARSVTGTLKHEGFEADLLSGEVTQKDRERVMAAIKHGKLRYMVATDVAARGIDISDLACVINYSVPENRDVYIHRTGRTGRIGKSGTAITLVGLRDLPKWGDIQSMKGLTLEERKLPTEEEILEKQVDRVIFAVRHLEGLLATPEEEAAADGAAAAVVPLAAHHEPPEHFRLAAERLLEQGVPARTLALLLEKALTERAAAAEMPREPAPPARPSEGGYGGGGGGGQRRSQRRRR